MAKQLTPAQIERKIKKLYKEHSNTWPSFRAAIKVQIRDLERELTKRLQTEAF